MSFPEDTCADISFEIRDARDRVRLQQEHLADIRRKTPEASDRILAAKRKLEELKRDVEHQRGRCETITRIYADGVERKICILSGYRCLARTAVTAREPRRRLRTTMPAYGVTMTPELYEELRTTRRVPPPP